MKIIEILVSPKGETTVTTKGFAGQACRDASKAIEASLGQRLSEQLTPESHQTQATEMVDRQRVMG